VPDRGVKIECPSRRPLPEPLLFGPGEWLGALGDIGTFVPLFLPLVALNHLPPVTTLLLVGGTYIASALYFRLPIPVQPLKAMSVIAIAGGLGVGMIYAAGLWMGSILMLLGLTGGVTWLSRLFTRPVVKGIQLGVGLMLVRVAVHLLAGSTISAGFGAAGSVTGLPLFIASLWILVIPQLPLTLGNAVFATADAAGDYFGERARRVTPRHLAISLGVSNLIAGIVGGLPVCHGSNGLTAHYRFGARSGGATVITGLFYILAALSFHLFDGSFLGWIPFQVLGAMLLYVGICHVLLVRRLERGKVVAWTIGIMALATSNLTYAMGAGMLLETAPRLLRRTRILPVERLQKARGFFERT
jgi:SulP family sulfate permease